MSAQPSYGTRLQAMPPLNSQTPFLGPQRQQLSPPRRLFRKRSQLVEEVFVAGDQSSWRLPSFPVFSCCTARVCSWVCGPAPQWGAGSPGLAGEQRLSHPSAGMLGPARFPLPQPLPPPGTLSGTEMGVEPCGHPQGGQGEPGMLGKRVVGEWDSQALTKGSSFSL